MPIEKMTSRARLHGACAHWLPLTALAVGIVGANPAPAQGQPAPAPPEHNGRAYYFKVSAEESGAFTVTNTRNGFSRTYRPIAAGN